MVQVDIFWTFAISSTFAAAAHRQLQKENSVSENKYWRYNLLFLSILFVPSGVYLLWINTGWETMYMLSRDMPAFIPCLFAMTNILCGLLGFYVTFKLIKAGQQKYMHIPWIVGYVFMFLILGIGWRRFTYAGTFEEWHQGNDAWFQFVWGQQPVVKYSVTDFFSCEIFWTLIGMGVIVGPAMIIPLFKWVKEGRAA